MRQKNRRARPESNACHRLCQLARTGGASGIATARRVLALPGNQSASSFHEKFRVIADPVLVPPDPDVQHLQGQGQGQGQGQASLMRIIEPRR